MRRRRQAKALPPWVLEYDPAAWSKPDETELAMGPQADHAWHCQRRWCEAKRAWLLEHPEAGPQVLEDLLTRVYPGRWAPGRPWSLG